jgi:hypothetical protein
MVSALLADQTARLRKIQELTLYFDRRQYYDSLAGNPEADRSESVAVVNQYRRALEESHQAR